MELLTANFSGKVRRETLNGKEYLVAPMSLITPGVLNGSKGPLYYPKEELSKNPKDWNHVPLVLYHPMVNGNPVSARDPEILNSYGLGYVFHAKANGKLTAEGWFDVAATDRIDSSIITALEEGKAIELSTGLFPQEIEPAAEGAVFNGVKYEYIARNYKPDHVAILPDQIGACSIKDGCGVLNSKPFTVHFVCNEMSHAQLHSMLTEQLKNKFKQTDPVAWISDVFDTYIIYSQGDDMFKLGYTKKGGDTHNNNFKDVVLSSEAPQKVMRETSFIPVANEENSMAKKELIDQLIANCSCWEEGDREVLANFSDEKVTGLIERAKGSKATEAVANAAREGFEDQQGNSHVFNEKSGKWESKLKEPEAPKEPVINQEKKEPANPPTEEEWLAQAPARIQQVVRNSINVVEAERTKLIDGIVANVEEGLQEDFKKKLATKELDELRDYALLANTNKKKEPANDPVANYFGRSGAAVSLPKAEEEEPLDIPTINWEELSKSA